MEPDEVRLIKLMKNNPTCWNYFHLCTCVCYHVYYVDTFLIICVMDCQYAIMELAMLANLHLCQVGMLSWNNR